MHIYFLSATTQQPQIHHHHRRHVVHYRRSTRHHARVVTTLTLQLHKFAREVARYLGAGDGGDRFEGHFELEGLARRDAAQTAARIVGL